MASSQYFGLAVELADILAVLDFKANQATFLYALAGAQQFQVFLRTAQTLFERLGVSISVNKYDDPVSVCSSLLVSANSLGLQLPAFPPAALRTGAGEAAVAFLHALASAVLLNSQLPSPRVEAATTPSDAEEEAEASDAAADEPFAFPSLPVAKNFQTSSAPVKIAETEWLQEVERASVRLSRETSDGIAPGSTSLGSRVSDMGDRIVNIAKERKFLEPSLAALKEEINQFTDTVEREERTAQEIFRAEGLGERARTNRLRLKELSTEINGKQDRVHSLEEELKFLDENLENAKTELDDWSDVATDTQPIVKIKEAIKKIKEETKAMDLRIAVLNHTLSEARTNRLFLQ